MSVPVKRLKHVQVLLGLCLVGTLPAPGWAACEIRSGAGTAALVELYTSEGCSSCPPADRQLGRAGEILGSGTDVVPLALHVDYWDYLGWQDAFAQPAFSARQSRLVERSGTKTVYTPQFFVNGASVGPSLDRAREQVAALNALPATASLRIKGKAEGNHVLALQVEARALAGGEPSSLYVALAESGLSSSVSRGENTGATLPHAHVVRAWLGPLPLAGGVLDLQREVPLSPDWNPAKLEVIAFIETEATGRVTQSVRAASCAGT